MLRLPLCTTIRTPPMKKALAIPALVLLSLLSLFAASDRKIDPYPAPVSNNAVAHLKIGKNQLVFSAIRT